MRGFTLLKGGHACAREALPTLEKEFLFEKAEVFIPYPMPTTS